MSLKKNNIEVCFAPALFQSIDKTNDFITVVVDVFRASTTICAALNEGVEKIIPVSSLKEAELYKSKGYIIAGEREGKKLDIATFGNSPYDFSLNDIPKEIVLSTSNGTVAIQTASEYGGDVVVGSFCNLTSLTNWLIEQNKSVVILCAGWLGSFSLEDSLFAGALVEFLLKSDHFQTENDSSMAALSLWENAKKDLLENALKFSHYKRLVKLGAEKDAKFALEVDSLNTIPFLKENQLINISS